MKKVRCAIYTRKSSEEGLDQSFNSLQAQREACEAYVRSQKSEGWIVLPAAYDDGGVSGGTLDRPALQRLLMDVDAGGVDLIVVYKIDRLTRSLADFAKLVERLDVRGVSFVSVTQQFNTSTSMSRLTLNVLLSFAQFEREVTGERIRDKIAASKARGMWMGGFMPLGYDRDKDGLKVNPAEAEAVREIFRTYLELKSVRSLGQELERKGVRSKARANTAARVAGGSSFSKGALYYLLSNPIYVGRIRHRDKVYDGLHQPILDQDTFDKVQKLLSEQRVVRRKRSTAKAPSPLAGKLFDEAGDRLVPTHASKGAIRYRYYVSQPLIGKRSQRQAGWRLPAQELEQRILDGVLGHGEIARLRQLAGDVGELDRAAVFEAVRRVKVEPDSLSIDVDVAALVPDGEAAGPISIGLPFDHKRRGVEMRLALKGRERSPDPTLARGVFQALRWVEQLKAGASTVAIAEAERINPSYVSRRIDLGLLSPRVIAALVDGRLPVELTAQSLIESDLPSDWREQERRLVGPD